MKQEDCFILSFFLSFFVRDSVISRRISIGLIDNEEAKGISFVFSKRWKKNKDK